MFDFEMKLNVTKHFTTVLFSRAHAVWIFVLAPLQ